MKEIKLESIAPPATIQAWYRKQIYAMISDIRANIKKDIVLRYESDIAMDGVIDWIGHIMDSIVSKWQKNLDTLSTDIATDFARRTQTNYDKRLQKILKKRGFAVNFRYSSQVAEQTQIVIGENVSLIKSIGNQYLDNVRAAVWRSVKGGYDTQGLIKQLMDIDGVTERRAKIIAKDQIAKANQAFERSRAEELGITHADWVHSSAGRTFRHDHVKANGTRYEIAKGCYISGEFIQPAEKINCRCRARLIIEIPESMVDSPIKSL